MRNMVRELFGENTGDGAAKELAQAFADTAELARKRANQAGASIPKREDWGLPQTHNQAKIARAGKEAWIDAVVDKLDWEKMRSYETGVIVPPQGRKSTLEKVYGTIITDGFIKEPTSGRRGSLATSLTDHRYLVFKDADSWLEYNKSFGETDVFSVMNGHFDYMSRQIALMEILGPNPTATKEWLKNQVKIDAAKKDVAKKGQLSKLETKAVDRALNNIDELYGVVSARTNVPVEGAFANTMAGLRNLITAAQLGSATLLAIPGDLATSRLAAKYNGLRATKAAKGILKLMNPRNVEDQRLAVRLGLIAENWSSVAAGQQRLVGNVLGPEVTRRIADVTMRASLLSPWTQAARWGFGMEFMGTLADRVGRSFEELDEPLRKAFQRYGITNEDWNLMRSTDLYEERGATFLRPDNLIERSDILPDRANNVANKFLEMIIEESNFAVPTASPRARAALVGQRKSGTLSGEIINSFSMYKNFPMTIAMTHLRRGLMETRLGDKGRYLASLTLA